MAFLLLLVGGATYLVSLAATLPARFIATRAPLPNQIIDVSGTVWNGQAIIKGGYEARWSVSPLESLTHLSLVADWTLAGADTRLNGGAALRPEEAILTDVEGRAGWGLVKLAAPDLGIACDATLSVSLSRIVLRQEYQGAEGDLRSSPATCSETAANLPKPVEAPPLHAVATTDGIATIVIVTTVEDADTPLADLSVRERIFGVTVYPAGAELTGVLPTSGPITLEYPF